MARDILKQKGTLLFVILGGFFVTNALVAQFLGSKLASLEKTLGIAPLELSLFGVGSLSLDFTAGVLLWPMVFVLTDVINEYFGRRGVRLLSFLAAGLIAYAFLMISGGMQLAPANIWHFREVGDKSLNMQLAFNEVFGQSLWIISGSLIAFLIGQLVDVIVFQYVKRFTGESLVWLRATGSTFVSQFIDSYVVLFIAFYWGADWTVSKVLAVGTVQYAYKFSMAIILTPVIYLFHYIIDQYLGEELSWQMRKIALDQKPSL